MGERLAGDEFAAHGRPGPIKGPPRPPSLASLAGPVALVGAALLAILWLIGQSSAPASAPAAAAGAAAAVAQEAAPVVVQAAPIAPSAPPAPPPLNAGTAAYDAPDGHVLGDVSGRERGPLVELYVLEYVSARGAMWVRSEVAGAGMVWLPLGAFAGQAVSLADLPCRGACSPPTPTPVPPTPVPPTPAPVYIVEPAPADAQPLTVIQDAQPTDDLGAIPTARPNIDVPVTGLDSIPTIGPTVQP
jgi:hypothetical protein